METNTNTEKLLERKNKRIAILEKDLRLYKKECEKLFNRNTRLRDEVLTLREMIDKWDYVTKES